MSIFFGNYLDNVIEESIFHVEKNAIYLVFLIESNYLKEEVIFTDRDVPNPISGLDVSSLLIF